MGRSGKAKVKLTKRMYNNNNERFFAYLLNGGPSLPLVCFVELSRFTKIDRMALRFFEKKDGGCTKVLHCPEEWNSVIKNRWKFGEESRIGFDEALVEVLVNGKSKKKIHEIALKGIIMREIRSYFSYTSRSNDAMMKKLENLFFKLRSKRCKDENYLQMLFHDDAVFSLGMLKHLYKQL
mmetsp:Transcript_3268/g.4590  ORF Transcript_3268/g.4590 Transcript_3268/m.4590 type:complete len:180 (+) Transcript_3268:267-806(+)